MIIFWGIVAMIAGISCIVACKKIKQRKSREKLMWLGVFLCTIGLFQLVISIPGVGKRIMDFIF